MSRSRSRSSLIVRIGRERGQFRGPDQKFFLARGRIHVPQFAVLSVIIVLQKRKLVPSGLHWMFSGPRPVSPPGAKIASMVSGFSGRG